MPNFNFSKNSLKMDKLRTNQKQMQKCTFYHHTCSPWGPVRWKHQSSLFWQAPWIRWNGQAGSECIGGIASICIIKPSRPTQTSLIECLFAYQSISHQINPRCCGGHVVEWVSRLQERNCKLTMLEKKWDFTLMEEWVGWFITVEGRV